MNDAALNRLIELSWRSKLTVAEEEEVGRLLAEHPDWSVFWQTESRLTRGLHELPDVTVASNFTARVLQSIDLDDRASVREADGLGGFLRRMQRRWLPRVAFGAVIATA